MAMLVSFWERARVGVTRMQLAPHLVRFRVLPGEYMLNSPPQGMLSSLHPCATCHSMMCPSWQLTWQLMRPVPMTLAPDVSAASEVILLGCIYGMMAQ